VLALDVADGVRYGDLIQPGDTIVFDASGVPVSDGMLALLVVDAAVAFGRARGAEQMEDAHGMILEPERYRVVGAVLRVIRDPNAMQQYFGVGTEAGQRAGQWMNTPNRYLDGETPAAVAMRHQDESLDRVLSALEREYQSATDGR
jgi:hypothetical protein